jgi:hypothetical protein
VWEILKPTKRPTAYFLLKTSLVVSPKQARGE